MVTEFGTTVLTHRDSFRKFRMRPRGRRVSFTRSTPTEEVSRRMTQLSLSLDEVLNYEMRLSFKNLLHCVLRNPILIQSLSFPLCFSM
jgi:hypothetical protein